MTTINHLGPYEISDVNNDILGNVVLNKGIPVIIKQEVGGEIVYAVLARNKDIRIIACGGGCFSRNMRITDGTPCKKCASFVKHWDTKDGVRRLTCKNSSSVDGNPVVVDFSSKPKSVDLESVNTSDLIAKLKRRKELEAVTEDLEDDDLLRVMTGRGIWPIFDARPTRLIHKLRRQVKKVGIENYYLDNKKKGEPHSSDKVGADIIDTGSLKTRQAKKRKFEKTHFEPKLITDFT